MTVTLVDILSLAQADVAAWGQYGPVGLFLAGVLAALGYVYKDGVARDKEARELHSKERAEWTRECKEERQEILHQHHIQWVENRTDVKASQEAVVASVKALEGAIRELHVDLKAARRNYNESQQ